MHRRILFLILFLGFVSSRLLAAADLGVAPSSLFGTTTCEGAYAGHLQGVCTDGRGALYWSWSDNLVKTDVQGRVLATMPVAYHHGDLCFQDGRIYVAVNFGKFNEPAGQADSWVYVYDGDTLAEVARHPVPEVVHGAGGIAYHDGVFLVVGGLPEGVDENYLYAYDESFRLLQRHVLASGYTVKGIQTAAYADGAWWFATYGDTRYVMRVDDDFALTGRWVFDASLGLAPLGNGAWLIGHNEKSGDQLHRGGVERVDFDAVKGPRLRRKP